jgi:hypothetical protein
MLSVRIRGKGEASVAFAYPVPWLQALTSELARQLGPVELELDPSMPRPIRKPESSPIELSQDATRLTLRIPARGFWSSALIPLVFSIGWLGFTGFFFGSIIVSKWPSSWPAALFAVPFVGAGLGILAMAVSRARRRAAVVVTEAEVEIIEEGPIRKKARRWSRAGLEVNSYLTNPSTTLSEGESSSPVYTLRMQPKGGEPVQALRGRPEDELEWIAFLIRKGPRPAMEPPKPAASMPDPAVPPPAADSGVARPVPQPKSSRAVFWPSVNGFRLELPPAGVFTRQKNGALVGALVLPTFSVVALGVIFAFFREKVRSMGPIVGALCFFVVIGSLLVLSVINARRRQGRITLTSGSLEVEQKSLFGGESFVVPAANVRSVLAVRTGGSTNNVPEWELRIEHGDGRNSRCFGGRDADELAWIASLLNQRLRS